MDTNSLIRNFHLQGQWTFLVGHRGVGKSSHLRNAFPKGLCLRQKLPVAGFEAEHADASRAEASMANASRRLHLDLDEEMCKQNSCTVGDLFAKGEKYFRELEKQTLLSLCQQLDAPDVRVIVAVGAGYEGEFPQNANVLWLRRRTDSAGRIFTDRPRLNAHKSPLAEYQERFAIREQRYSRCATSQLVLREGQSHVNQLADIKNVGGFTTLRPWNFANIEDLLAFGMSRIELRDDLLTSDEILEACRKIPAHQLLLSFRRNLSSSEKLFRSLPPEVAAAIDIDWPIEWDPCVFAMPTIASLHGSFADWQKLRAKLARSHAHQKVAIQIENWQQLRDLHAWYQEDPEQRSFLPISKTGRWLWYRQIHSQMAVQFWQQGLNEIADQPTLLERYAAQNLKNFAAILGSPVAHSWTPTFHEEFFKNKNAAVVAIDMTTDEFNTENLNFLSQLGMQWAAVTSPLKLKAAELVSELSPEAKELSSVNTLKLVNKQWIGHNTDYVGLQKLLVDVKTTSKIAVWGGGGVLALVRKVLPHAEHWTATQGAPENEHEYDYLIWASGWFEKLKFPPQQWTIKHIIDLNYAENSPGRELAVTRKIPYTSGEAMFFAQGFAQQEFWL